MRRFPCYQAPRYENVWGSGGIGPRILNLGTRCRWVVNPKPRAPRPRYPPNRRLGGFRSRSGRGGEERENPFEL